MQQSRLRTRTAPARKTTDPAPLWTAAVCAICVLVTTSPPVTPVAAQAPDAPDVWQPLRYFVGSWEGKASGQPGAGTVEREYRFVLEDRFLHARNRSTYPPQEKNPKGEVHEDWSFFSYDRGRRRLVLRQFHVEGFVNQYVLEGEAGDGVLVFVSESIENIPAGWRARETYRRVGPDEFVEVFEIAAPGKDFELYSENRLTRRQTPIAWEKGAREAR